MRMEKKKKKKSGKWKSIEKDTALEKKEGKSSI